MGRNALLVGYLAFTSEPLLYQYTSQFWGADRARDKAQLKFTAGPKAGPIHQAPSETHIYWV